MSNARKNVPVDQPSIREGIREGIYAGPINPDATDRLATKITPPGQVSAEPLRNGSWLIRIGRAKYEKRLQLTRNEAAELVRVLTRDVLTAAETAP